MSRLAVRGLAIRGFDYSRKILCVTICRSRPFPSNMFQCAIFLLLSKLATKIILYTRSIKYFTPSYFSLALKYLSLRIQYLIFCILHRKILRTYFHSYYITYVLMYTYTTFHFTLRPYKIYYLFIIQLFLEYWDGGRHFPEI